MSAVTHREGVHKTKSNDIYIYIYWRYDVRSD